MPRHIAVLATLAAAALVAAGCGGSSDTQGPGSAGTGGAKKTTLSLVAYSTPQVAYDQIIPGFQKTEEGSSVGFTTSYGASGALAVTAIGFSILIVWLGMT